MNALIVLLFGAITLGAGALLLDGDLARVGVAGTLLGGVLGFAATFTMERYRRQHDDAHRFEQERRAVYVRLLEAVADAEAIIRSRHVAAWVKRDYPGIDHGPIPDRPDLKGVDLLVEEVQILAPFSVYASARLVSLALRALDYAVNAETEEWDRSSGELTSARSNFLRRAKADLGTPTGVMTSWQERRYRVRKRLGLTPTKKVTEPTDATTPNTTRPLG